MPDPQAPKLPKGAPKDLVDFVDCRSASVTIGKGKVTWLDLPEDAPAPDLSVEPGDAPGSAKINVGLFGITVATLPASIDASGQLTVDTSALPDIDLLKGARDALDKWVKDLNDWLKFNKKRLKPAVIRNGGVTLTKEAIPPAATPPPSPTPPPAGPGKPPDKPPEKPPAQPPVEPTGPSESPADGGGTRWGCLGLFVLLFFGIVGGGVIVLGQPHPGATPSPAPSATTAAVALTPVPTTSATSVAVTIGPPTSTGTPVPATTPTPEGASSPSATQSALASGSPAPLAALPGLQSFGLLASTATLTPGTTAEFYSGADSHAGRTSPTVDIADSFGEVADRSADVVTASFSGVHFPCGQVLDGRLTVCASGSEIQAGPLVTVGASMAAAVPTTGPDERIYSAVFDSDGNAANNLRPSAVFPNDTYQGTDRWYELTYLPKTGTWALSVTDARKPGITRGNATASSGARAVVWGNTVVFFIPASEFADPSPHYRIATTITDGTFARSTTGVDVSSGGPGTDWALQALDQPGGPAGTPAPPSPQPSASVAPSPVSVSGGCITAVKKPFDALPLTLRWHLTFAGASKFAAVPGLEILLSQTPTTGTLTTGVIVVRGAATFVTPASVGPHQFLRLTMVGPGGQKLDLTASLVSVFGAGFTVSAAGGETVGPSC